MCCLAFQPPLPTTRLGPPANALRFNPFNTGGGLQPSGFLHRLMSLEYKGESLEDNGLRSGELKFLPLNLRRVADWEGTTNAYHMPDGSGFEVRQLHHVLPRLERIEVPAGAFRRCVHVETKAIHSAIDVDGTHTGPQVVLYYSDWYAPGVGLVRTDQRDADAHAMTTIELVHYVVGAHR